MCDFGLNTPISSRCWFPCMITSMCINQGVRSQAYTTLEKLNPGPIDKSILERSRSQSRRATSQAAAPAAGPSFSQPGPSSSRPRSPTPRTPKKGSKTVTWLKQLLQCHRAGLKNDAKIMKKQEKLDRGQRRIEDKANWVIAQFEASSSERYVPPPEFEEPEEEEDDNEEEEEEEDDSEEE